MKLFSILFTFLLFISFAFSYKVDKCCIVGLLNYKEELKNVRNNLLLQKPSLLKYVDSYIYLIQNTINSNKNFSKNKLKIYRKIIDRLQNYIYNRNIVRGSLQYNFLAYFTLRIKDLYEYESNKKKYKLENMLNNLSNY